MIFWLCVFVCVYCDVILWNYMIWYVCVFWCVCGYCVCVVIVMCWWDVDDDWWWMILVYNCVIWIVVWNCCLCCVLCVVCWFGWWKLCGKILLCVLCVWLGWMGDWGMWEGVDCACMCWIVGVWFVVLEMGGFDGCWCVRGGDGVWVWDVYYCWMICVWMWGWWCCGWWWDEWRGRSSVARARRRRRGGGWEWNVMWCGYGRLMDVWMFCVNVGWIGV